MLIFFPTFSFWIKIFLFAPSQPKRDKKILFVLKNKLKKIHVLFEATSFKMTEI